MQTKVAWYLNPFFPLFSLAVGAALARGFWCNGVTLRARRRVLAAAFVLAFGVAETKLAWYSFHKRNLDDSTQGALIDAKADASGRRMFKHGWTRAERFVASYVVGAVVRDTQSLDEFVRESSASDFILIPRTEATLAALTCISTNARYALCQLGPAR